MADDGADAPESGYALWGARFGGGLSDEAAALNRSLPLDRRLWREEVEVDIAWVSGLAAAGVIDDEAANRLRDGLERVARRIEDGAAEGATDEDIHTLVERLLGDEVGELAGVLRTGRSRNDQVATAARLWCLRVLETLDADVRRLEVALLERAESTIDVLMPAYTHLQRAQPVRMAHFFLSHFWPLERDRSRLSDLARRTSVLPLGSGAVAGSGFPVDREELARRLGFASVSRNSIDAVSDRDFIAEFAFVGALLGAHLSRVAEDLILFSSAEFAFVRFADSHSTGSSLMPQKRNPDIAELARGRAARLLGEATAALALLKGLPTGYNKDLQGDKTVLFSVFDSLHELLPAFAGSIETLDVDPEAARAALDPAMLAVDIADALVRAGVPFRQAHAAVGLLVRRAEELGAPLTEVEADPARSIHPELPDALAAVAATGADAHERSVEARAVTGGSARAAVEDQITAARSALDG